ncbi:MAG: secondary thiamine-phosphate synthase enzyme YjbQ [Pseudomonadota bacterium]
MTNHHRIITQTTGRGFYELTHGINAHLQTLDQACTLCHLFILHTSASLVITEHADPDVLIDLETHLSSLIEDGDSRFRHRAEGPDDMSAHVRSVLTQTHLTLAVESNRLMLGTWQGVFLWEHRYAPHRRSLLVSAV